MWNCEYSDNSSMHCLIFLTRKQPSNREQEARHIYTHSRFPSPSLGGRRITGIRRDLAGEMVEFAESAPAASFPVVLFDGEREIEFGSILVHPSLGFRRFQTIISQKIGISLNQISSSLVRRKKARSSPEIARKVPINESSDFSAISRERNCFVLVTLKRSPMRTRSRRRRGGDAAYAEEPDQKKAAAVAPKKILKRNPADGSGIGFPFHGDNIPAAGRLGIWDYEGHLQNVRKQKERYLLTTTTTTYPPYAEEEMREAMESPYGGGMLGWHRPAALPEEWAARSFVCDLCRAQGMEGRSPAFHWCVYDVVTVGFRSSVGPIQRPLKKHIDALA